MSTESAGSVLIDLILLTVTAVVSVNSAFRCLKTEDPFLRYLAILYGIIYALCLLVLLLIALDIPAA